MKILRKATDVAKPKAKDQNALIPRETKIVLPEVPSSSPYQPSSGNLDLLKHKKESGDILHDTFNALSKTHMKELKECNNAARRNRNKRKGASPLPGSPPSACIKPLSNSAHSGKVRNRMLKKE